MPRRILIVDDEPHIRLLLEQTLEDWAEATGVELLSASNGLDALALIQSQRPNLVFLDVMMPQMNGFDVCRQVKQELALEGIYIVLLTAKGQEFDKAQGRAVGADQYMTKPFDPDQVVRCAMEVLGC
ncbi:MAG: response regulator [Gloeomargarita sp. SKYG116]|nr:response regulator [Gloeomargarita sp. SKYG116]MCS7225938.1 response regulator [Gloeomargarita sp. SKYB31]MDW8400086.1 response regulator [Gloeomargarita sp. SKYGB_i_bin116]